MTSPVERIEVECPACGVVYETTHRASLNLDLDEFTTDEIREATTATCPSCGQVVEIASLVVEAGVWRFTSSGAKRPGAAHARRAQRPKGGTNG